MSGLGGGKAPNTGILSCAQNDGRKLTAKKWATAKVMATEKWGDDAVTSALP